MLSCNESNNAGQPCSSRTAKLDPDGVPRCFVHSQDPERIARRRKPSRNAAPAPPRTPTEVARYLGWAVRAVALGKLDAKAAAVIEKMCAGIIDALDAAEMRERLATLEAEVKEARRG